MTTDLREVGVSVVRKDGLAKVTGAAEYLDDLTIPNAAVAALVRSPYAHARIVRIDGTPAAATPGVLAVITTDDLGEIGARRFGSYTKDQPVLARGVVRFEGEPVAAVVATDARTARAAAALVDVEYDELACAVDVHAALATGAPLVHETAPPLGRQGRWPAVPGTNICARVVIEQGNVDAGLAEADVVIEQTYTFPRVFHYTLEPHGAVASVASDEVTVWTNTGHPYQLRQELADTFGISLNRIRVVVPYVGGSFGGKSFPKLEPLAAALSWKVGRPVKVLNGVEGSMRTNRRNGATCHVTLGLRRDGTLTAKRCRVLLDTGAYADSGPLVADKASVRMLGPYRVPHYHIDVQAVYTNTTPAGSYRSIGGPQTVWASESIMDEAADAIGMDAVELRLHNLVKRGEPVRPDLRPMDADLGDDLERLAKTMDLTEGGRKTTNPLGRGVGVAIANPAELPISTSIVRLHYDGSVTVLCSTVEVGQGLHTVLAQIAAEELGIDHSLVTVVSPDTRYGPYDWSTGASRGTAIVGSAVQRACRDIKDQLRALAAESAGVPVDGITIGDGSVHVGGRAVEYAQVIREWFGRPAGEVIGRGYVRNLGPSPAFWEIGMGGAEVEVDRETGEVRLRSYTALADVGRAINPQQCEAQDIGAVVMGLGHTLFEEMVYSESGSLLNATMLEYRVPVITDLPETMETVLIENADGTGPFGAKGMGEGGGIPVAPAVANAIARATGVRIRDLPLTPERVWRALRVAGRAAAPSRREASL
ncbi:MAG: xanthine dehydrogenase family protein molybdopterin-binding subunit [Candidatus Rokubacteria bacterium]|nr:xanthine dehydrogenase family protein molybdopterin-binding subunit [Candidatus Rokubacteria bacterium]